MENCFVGVKELNKLVSTERKMVRMICGVTLKDRINSSEIAERVNLESIEDWLETAFEVVWVCNEKRGGYRSG